MALRGGTALVCRSRYRAFAPLSIFPGWPEGATAQTHLEISDGRWQLWSVGMMDALKSGPKPDTHDMVMLSD
ncbi:MAG: hypothetical protein ACYCOU_19480 [Sulfobacillus sp.]